MQFFKPVQKNVVDPLSLVLNIKVAKIFDRFFKCVKVIINRQNKA